MQSSFLLSFFIFHLFTLATTTHADFQMRRNEMHEIKMSMHTSESETDRADTLLKHPLRVRSFSLLEKFVS